MAIPKLAIVTCMWKRHRLVDATLCRLVEARRELERELDVVVVVAGSEGKTSARICNVSDAVIYLETPNRPLSAKWNAAFARARLERPDAAVMIGSDDWTTPDALRVLFAGAAQHGYVGVADMYMFDLRTGRSCFWAGYEGRRFNDTLGALRTIRADVLDRVGWKLFERARDRALDYEMTQRLRAVGVEEPRIVASRVLLDVKGGGPNICGYDAIQPRTAIDPAELEQRLGAGTLATLARLR